MSEQAAQAVRAAIRERGPIPFSAFMEIALYGPGGFYERPPVGERGHFVTSPHVHPLFGSLVAKAIRQAWAHLGQPAPFHVVEVGAGDGTLARQVFEELRGLPLEYVAVERSSGARLRLAEVAGIRVEASLEVIHEGVTGFVFANELLDNVPFERVRGTDGGPVQVAVDLRGEELVEVEIPCVPEIAELAPRLDPGEESPVSPAALSLLDRVARVLARGYAVFIDYGSEAGSAAHGYRAQRVVHDLLADPGEADITAGVAFDPLERRAAEWNLEVFGPIPQRRALAMLGIGRWLEDERLKQVGALDRREGREAILTWESRQRAAQLVDPQGLGALQWLWLATPGCGWWQGLLEGGDEGLF